MLGIAVVWWIPSMVSDPFTQHVLLMTLIWGLCGQAWNFLGGYAGQLAFGNAAYFGIGAYTTAALRVMWGVSPWIGLLGGAMLACVFALLIGIPLFRLEGKYYVIATIAAAQIVWIGTTNWEWLGGARGMFMPLTNPGLLNLYYDAKIPYIRLASIVLVVTIALTYYMSRNKLGYYFRAIAQDPQASAAAGIDIRRCKLTAAAMCAALTAIAGGLYACYVLYIDPDSVLHHRISLLICLIPILGGSGTVIGPLIGAFLLVPLSELTRVYLSGGGAALDLVVYGALIVAVALFEPRGIMGMLARLYSAATQRQRRKASDGFGRKNA